MMAAALLTLCTLLSAALHLPVRSLDGAPPGPRADTERSVASPSPAPADGVWHAHPQRQSYLRGKVVDDEGNPIAGVKITIELFTRRDQIMGQSGSSRGNRTIGTVSSGGAHFEIETNEKGEYNQSNIREKTNYRVRFEKEGWVVYEHGLTTRVAVNKLDVTLRKASPAPSPKDAVTATYERGMAAHEAGDYAAASQAMVAVVNNLTLVGGSEELLADALMILGDSNLRGGRLDEAAAAYERLLAAGSEDPAVHFGMGQVMIGRGRFAEALGHYSMAAALEPEKARAQFDLGSLQLLTGDASAALESFELALVVDAVYADAQRGMAMAWVELGDNLKAVAAFRTYLEMAPEATDRSDVEAYIAELEGSGGQER